MSQVPNFRLRSVVAIAATALLATGCASVSPDGGFDSVTALASDRLGKDARLVRTDADAGALARLIDAKLRVAAAGRRRGADRAAEQPRCRPPTGTSASPKRTWCRRAACRIRHSHFSAPMRAATSTSSAR